ncbi:MAG: hypothetical protein ACI4IX_02090 [Acutalibacteraceae bacterium]
MKKSKKILSVLLCFALLLQAAALGTTAFAAESGSYTIVSPYKDVIWSGENAWGAYRGNLHSHTTYSDADIDLETMVKKYYELGYDFLANSDHGVTGVEWNREPSRQLLYSYQELLGNKVAHLSDEDYAAITNGTYDNRGYKMVCVTGANELNNLSLSKNHVNGYFLPSNVGNGFGGIENEAGYEKAIKFIQDNGGLSHINHPGDWIESNANPEAVNDPYNIKLFGDLILKYDSCLGTEVLNEKNGTTGYDRVLWDNLLMYCLPYGKTVIGFSNTDAHTLDNVDSSFSVFMMEENTVDNIKATMQNGAFFAVTRILRGNDFEIGPKEGFDVRNTDLAYPMFTELSVDGHRITVTATDAEEIQFIANGKVILKQAIGSDAVVLDLDQIDGAADFEYVRVELKGQGGMCLSQALIIDDGSEPLTFEENATLVQKLVIAFKGTKLWTIIQEISYMIKK